VLRELLEALAGQGRMVFYCSHVLEVVEKVCSRVLILRKGRIVADDSVERLRELMHQPSLEGVFAQLTREQGGVNVAGRLLEVIGAADRREGIRATDEHGCTRIRRRNDSRE
jgi:ABC-2 type transport system ATP-binding protein